MRFMFTKISRSYFEHPPRYQILHCLRNRVVGGTSMFVDAVHAASMLRNTNPEAFDMLATTPVAFHYINDGHHLHHSHPTIELAPALPTSSINREQPINYINYSPPFQAPLSLSTTSPAFYPALAEFASLLAKPELTFEYTLNEGDAVLFDNRRLLHARTAFSDREGGDAGHDGEMSRWLKGCYLEGDALLDRGRVLRTKAEQGLL
jgi:gamma-butyrobetaine dioxygenase